MAYRGNGNGYTYPPDTQANILAISNPSDWDTVWCTDDEVMYYYHPDGLWAHVNCQIFDVESDKPEFAEAVRPGSGGSFSDSERSVEECTFFDEFVVGIALDKNAADTRCSVIMCGKAKMKTGNSAVNIGDGLVSDGAVNGTVMPWSGTSKGTFATALEDASIGGTEFWGMVHVKRCIT